MIFKELEIEGVLGISAREEKDARGSLMRIWDNELIPPNFKLSQASHVVNFRKSTLRGLHYQREPHSEQKMVFCYSGMIFDCIVDLRKESKTFGNHVEINLGMNCEFQGVIIPKNFAHGYLTLKDNTNLIYFMDEPFCPEFSAGLKWNSPALAIKWPSKPKIISNRDQEWPEFSK
jgi:dTDP-4-dehydrorhamnose 3,5-epimerase